MQVAASEPSGDPVGGRVPAQRQFDDGGKDLGLLPADVEPSAYVVIFFLRESAFAVSIVYRHVIRRDVPEDGVKAFRYGESGLRLTSAAGCFGFNCVSILHVCKF